MTTAYRTASGRPDQLLASGSRANRQIVKSSMNLTVSAYNAHGMRAAD